MDVILLERVAKLGQMGEVVKVKDGYARNFLLPHGKALRVNPANVAAEPRDAPRGAGAGRQARRADLRGHPLGLGRRQPLRFRQHP